MAAETSEGEMPYTEWLNDGRSIGGMMDLTGHAADTVPVMWNAYFAVANIEETLALAEKLGAKVVSPARTIAEGTFAILSDPNGAVFSVMQMKS